MAPQANLPEFSIASHPEGTVHRDPLDPDQLADHLEEAQIEDTQMNIGENNRISGPTSDPEMSADLAKALNPGPSTIIPKMVLESESSEIGPQIQEELKIRQLPRKRAKNEAKISKAAMAKPVSQGFHFGRSDKMLVLRIRIQSPAILAILGRIITDGEETWDSKLRTFFRPFSPLIFYHKRVCEYLIELQERWPAPEALDPTRTPASLAESDQDGSSGKLSVDDCPAALADLRCYVKFMNEEVMTFYTKFDKMSSADEAPAKVRFHDLWYLFRVGELVFRPVGSGANREINNLGLGARTWRCYGTRPVWARHRIAPSEHRSYTGNDDSERASFGVHCYYIDYTGEEFCAVTETFEIPPFPGERPIKSLKVYPYRFQPKHADFLSLSIDSGRKFLESIKTRHAAYNGWTTTVTPKGGPSTDVEGKELRPEFVDSEVIVDFVEAFQACPKWKPEADIVKPEEPVPYSVPDDFLICWWSDEDRSKHVGDSNEIIMLQTGITIFERNNNLSENHPTADRFLIKIRDNDRNGKSTIEDDLCLNKDDPHYDLPLLTSRIFAYVLRDRKFMQLIVQQLRIVKKSTDAFEYLKINRSHKNLIQSLVEEHFEKLSDRQDGVDGNSIDLIKGKGKGLFILLYGVPGVGKTATAEAIDAANGKPLFPITCGDLGLTPTEVETALQKIFRLADTWKCVLLLDEVDTFFSQRAKGDATLAKNALVSVFLRMLEYYDGLLFLTTNRPGTLDEAFKSRIHLKLYYPPLGFEQTMEIWAMNIERLNKIEQGRCRRSKDQDPPMRIMKKRILRFAEDTFEENGTSWNGRQIRNAFQVSSSLAHYEARKDGISPPRLTVDHFKMIYSVTEDFDKYMCETIGKTDSGLAFDRGDREDDYVPAAHSGQQHHYHHHDHPSDEAKESDDAYEEAVMLRSPRARYGASNRRRPSSSSNMNPRSVSPTIAGLSQSAAGGGGGIFGPSLAGIRPSSSPMREQHGARRRPHIEVTDGDKQGMRAHDTTWGESERRSSGGGESGDRNPYLSPDTPRIPRDWHSASGNGKWGRERGRGEEDVGRRQKKKPKTDSEDEMSE